MNPPHFAHSVVALVLAAGLTACASGDPTPEAPPVYTEVTPPPTPPQAPPPEAPPQPPPASATETPPQAPPPETPPPRTPPPKTPPPKAPPEPLPAGAQQVTFVRVGSLSVGGDFDSSGDEEVVVDVDVDGASERLLERGLDLPDDSLETFPFEESERVELPEKAEVRLHLAVVESDVTEDETMCGTDRAIVVNPLKVTSTESVIEVPLSTIRGESSGLFQATKRFVIEGPSLELRLVRVARRDAPDDVGRALVREAFAPVTAARPPTTDAERTDLQRSMQSGSFDARRTGACSTHTWARKTIADLVDQAAELETLLGESIGPGESARSEAVAGLRTALEAVPAADRATPERRASCARIQAVVDGAADPALFEAARAALGGLSDRPASFDSVSDALDQLDGVDDQTIAAAEAAAKVGPALAALQAKLAGAVR